MCAVKYKYSLFFISEPHQNSVPAMEGADTFLKETIDV